MESNKPITYCYGSFTGAHPHPIETAQLQTILRSDQYTKLVQLWASGPIDGGDGRKIFDFCSPLRYPTSIDDWADIPRGGGVLCGGEPRTGRLTSLFKLRRLAQICAHWRGLVMGTPALWTTIEMDFGYANISTAANKRIVQFESSAFPPLEGCEHLDRASFVSAGYQVSDVRKGHFPLLERLLVDGVPVDHDLFQFSPRLAELTLEAHDFPAVVSAVVSAVHSLAINFCHGISLGFVKFLGCITLRRARVLLLKTEHTFYPVCWPQTAFLAFSTRSSLHDTLLRVLEIFNLAISGDQLVECLAGLPRVEILSVSDPNHWDAVPDNRQLLINDDLLRGLTWTSDTGLALVPQLHSFACDTFMQFEESSYVGFISSSVGPGRNADGPFESSILYSRGKGATVEAPLAKHLSVRLSQFVLRKELRSRIERDDLRSFSYVEKSE
ncbi:hypothetical protein DFH08DRAFT_941716 [Mycena albidolilacea]|uniref:F-box domain-containing protein n=1 Tax=Mycena albidolilacea TaxID=1033008 RepID=A0AAD6ZHG6_9AGAR|nr:hypothetical protein DFH08DRAFT_941716 [Mycena albidolilacea]